MAQLEEQPAGFTPTALGNIDRLRARAALAMVIASVAVGFMAGRASVWLVPFERSRRCQWTHGSGAPLRCNPPPSGSPAGAAGQ